MVRVSVYEGVNRGCAFTQEEVQVTYWTEQATEGVKSEFSELVVHRFQAGIEPCMVYTLLRTSMLMLRRR